MMVGGNIEHNTQVLTTAIFPGNVQVKGLVEIQVK